MTELNATCSIMVFSHDTAAVRVAALAPGWYWAGSTQSQPNGPHASRSAALFDAACMTAMYDAGERIMRELSGAAAVTVKL